MTDNRIRSLVNSFRKKIDRAQRKDLFIDTMVVLESNMYPPMKTAIINSHCPQNRIQSITLTN